MLELLRRAWRIKWAKCASDAAASPSAGLAGGAGAAAAAASCATPQLLRRLLGPLGGAASSAEGVAAGSGALRLRPGDYHQADQLLALQACVAQILGRCGAPVPSQAVAGDLTAQVEHRPGNATM
jgi:hypothetical protein